MVNLRTKQLLVRSSTSIEVRFTTNLNTNIGVDNIVINGAGGNSYPLVVRSLSILNDLMTISVRPMIPGVLYEMVLFSTIDQVFEGLHGERLVEDGNTNHLFFTGMEEENDTFNSIKKSLPSIYDPKPGTLIHDLLIPTANEIESALHSANEVKSANYISVEVIDEEITRGSGPFDRFANEGVFKLLRVGGTLTNANINKTLSFSSFPLDPISLQEVTISKEIVSNLTDSSNGFNGLLITLSKVPVIKVTSITLVRGLIRYTYDLETYRYGIKESKYDSENSYSAFDIEDSQIRLSSAAIGPFFPLPQGNDTFEIDYIYKKIGRTPGVDSVTVSEIVSVIRENVLSVATSFFLEHAPIVTLSGDAISTGGIQWLDPSTNFNSNIKHPAFITEIPFSESSLPTLPGEYTVNYLTGQVIVFGVNGSGTDGTTVIPPVASYNFRRTFQDGLDYNLFTDLWEVAAVPGRDLEGADAIINFQYEENFAENTDFLFSSHIETIDERIGNSLIGDFGIITQKGPVNEVFRIFNETTGEIYAVSRISGNQVFFNAFNPPVLTSVLREAVSFNEQVQAQIVVSEEIIIPLKSFVAFKVELQNSNIISATSDYIGASFNSSLTFSNTSVFIREIYFNTEETLDQNLQRLEQVGDYIVDYVNGIVYLAVIYGADTDIGDASYRFGEILTLNPHIVQVSNLYRSANPRADNIVTFNVGDVEDKTVGIKDLEQIGESSVNGSPIVVTSDLENNYITLSKDALRVRHIFQVTDLQTSTTPVDFELGSIISSSEPTTIIFDSDGVPVIDLGIDNTGLTIQTDGLRKFIEVSRLSNIVSGIIQLATLVNKVSDPNFLLREYWVINIETGVNYFSFGNDGYIDASSNRIYLPSGVTDDAIGEKVEAKYRAALLPGAAVLVDYTPGDMFIDYTYVRDEILISYEYGDNVIDWSISETLTAGETYFASYRYGALRNSLRDNFGILTSIPELSTAPLSLEREMYRSGLSGSLQSFLKGPTIPSVEEIVKAFTAINPNITESVFFEWILGRDYLNLIPMKLNKADAESESDLFAPGKFGYGLFLNSPGQTATLPATSNMRFADGTWECQFTPTWMGIDNDATLTFDILFDGYNLPSKVFIGSSGFNPTTIPFSIDKLDPLVLGKPLNLHTDNGYFIWYDSTAKKWRIRARAPIDEMRIFSGSISTSGEFGEVAVASSIDGYGPDDGYGLDEVNDYIRSTSNLLEFSFTIDSYDLINLPLDSYGDNYHFAGFDGIDLQSDNIHYLFDTGVENAKSRMSLYKDGQGFLKFRVYDSNGRLKMLSANIRDWEIGETHPIAASWKLGTVEQRDEMHLFIDGMEIPNTYRFSGYLPVPTTGGVKFMDTAGETLLSDSYVVIIGNNDLLTTLDSPFVYSPSATFITSGVSVGNQFTILDNTIDGINTRISPYVFISQIVDEHTLKLEIGPAGSGVPCLMTSTLSDVKYSINQTYLATVSDPIIEKIRIYEVSLSGEYTELRSPLALNPDYSFYRDGYQDYIVINNGIPIGSDIILYSYGLTQQRTKQLIYIWPYRKTNLFKTITPQPTAISKIRIINIINKKIVISNNTFSTTSTIIDGYSISTLSSNLSFCQPSNFTNGRSLSISISGDNFDFMALNQVTVFGNTMDGYSWEQLSFTDVGTITTSLYFTSIVNISAIFTPFDVSSSAGTIEIKEHLPITQSENSGDYAQIRLSVIDQYGSFGSLTSGSNIFSDAYARFGAEDINKLIYIENAPFGWPSFVFTIIDVLLDPSGTVKDSNTVIVSGTMPLAGTYNGLIWTSRTLSFSDSGFANGLMTLETANSGGLPFLLSNCWYETDFPSYAVIPWEKIPETLYIGSDINEENQASGVIDELHILGESLTDTGIGEVLPSSGRSVTSEANSVREITPINQSLALFHFNGCVSNKASFYSNFSGSYFQSSNSVNSLFNQSAIFNQIGSLSMDNNGIFFNNSGTIEFWVNPILDTYNDPSRRYYIDLGAEQTVTGEALSALIVRLPIRARSVSSVMLPGDNTNYFSAGSLDVDGITIHLGQPISSNSQPIVSYVPIDSQGDRFSIFKEDNNTLSLLVTASGLDYQISAPIYWKKNTWHRIFVGWSLNNIDNQDRLILMVDGAEKGIIRYGTGLRYGSGYIYGMPTIWGQAGAGTLASRNILADINLTDFFSAVHIGGDFTGQFPAMAKMDNLRFSSELRSFSYLGGSGPGQLIGHDLLYTGNVETAQPVIEDALTTLLLDFDTDSNLVEDLITVNDASSGIFDFFVNVIDSFKRIPNQEVKDLITQLINRLKPAHTRAFIDFGDDDNC